MTARGDLLRQLFGAYATNDDESFRLAAESVIQEERAKNHRLLAEDLQRILSNGRRSGGQLTRRADIDIPRDRERGFPLFEVGHPTYDWDRLVAPARTIETLRRVVEEHCRADLLASAGLKPTQILLFYGPPGCGKTLSAHVMAGVLGLPLLTVRFDAVVSSFLGETAANLRKVFDAIEKGRWVVLFDEFDAIGKDRDNVYEHGELKRVVNTLLQLVDAFRGDSLLIAATNHHNLLDSAVWRRFGEVVPFTPPNSQDRELLLRHFLRGFDTGGLNLRSIARRLESSTGADIEGVAVRASRLAVLRGRTAIEPEDLKEALRAVKDRQVALGSLPIAEIRPESTLDRHESED